MLREIVQRMASAASVLDASVVVDLLFAALQRCLAGTNSLRQPIWMPRCFLHSRGCVEQTF